MVGLLSRVSKIKVKYSIFLSFFCWSPPSPEETKQYFGC